MKTSWRTLSKVTDIPSTWRPWLENTGSMTRALEEASGEACQILVQKEAWQKPWEDEQISGEGDALCWVREVIVIARKPMIFARAVFPRALIEDYPEFMRLGTLPLGHILFAKGVRAFQRGAIEVAEISAGQPLWAQIPETMRPEKCWARRSIFSASSSSFLLSEVFLRDITSLKLTIR